MFYCRRNVLFLLLLKMGSYFYHCCFQIVRCCFKAIEICSYMYELALNYLWFAVLIIFFYVSNLSLLWLVLNVLQTDIHALTHSKIQSDKLSCVVCWVVPVDFSCPSAVRSNFHSCLGFFFLFSLWSFKNIMISSCSGVLTVLICWVLSALTVISSAVSVYSHFSTPAGAGQLHAAGRGTVSLGLLDPAAAQKWRHHCPLHHRPLHVSGAGHRLWPLLCPSTGGTLRT